MLLSRTSTGSFANTACSCGSLTDAAPSGPRRWLGAMAMQFKRHHRQLRVIKSRLSRIISIECPPEATKGEFLLLCRRAEEKLDQLEEEPLTAKMVEESLSITSAELRRWSKDGRVPTSGRAHFSQGRKQVTLFLYPPDAIRRLAMQPSLISEWRLADGGTPFTANR